jgi:hypothetical protein
MFFDDATAAFTNLRRALRPGGRMTVVVWQPRDRSPLFEIPLAIARRRAADIGLDPDAAVVPVDGGPFSFGVADRTRAVLAAAGWSQIEQVPHVLDLYSGGPGAVDVAADVALEVGPIRALLDGATPDQREQMRAGLVEGLAEHHDGAGVRLAGAVVVVRGIA